MEPFVVILLRILVVLILMLITIPALATLCFFPYPKKILNPDVYLILGCAPQKDGTLSNMMQSRVDEAISQYRFRKRPLLFTGWANKHTRSEASLMAEYAANKGIPVHHILLEEHARSTFENFQNVLPILKERGFTDICVITNRFHMRRAYFFARKFHLTSMAASASLKNYLPAWHIFLLLTTETVLRLKCLYYEWKLRP